jgi:ABC-type branched-subunit amino acid transport system ATPase component
MPPHAICHLGMSRTFQIVKPFPEMSVLDNVMMGAFKTSRKASRAREKAIAVLELLEFADWAERRAGDLPIAGRKRLEIAKVLATEPKLIRPAADLLHHPGGRRSHPWPLQHPRPGWQQNLP